MSPYQTLRRSSADSPAADASLVCLVVVAAVATRLVDTPDETHSWGLAVAAVAAGLLGALLHLLTNDHGARMVAGLASIAATIAVALAAGERDLFVATTVIAALTFTWTALMRPQSNGFVYAVPAAVLVAGLEPTSGTAAGLMIGAVGAVELLSFSSPASRVGASSEDRSDPSPEIEARPPAPNPPAASVSVPPPVAEPQPAAEPQPTAEPASPLVVDMSVEGLLQLGQPARAANAVGSLTTATPYFVQANASECCSAGQIQIAAASRRGYSHIHDATPRQDDYAVELSPDGRYAIAAVADGLGSADLSHIGAQWAVRGAIREFVTIASTTPLSQISPIDLAARTSERMRALTRSVLASDEADEHRFSTTLVLAAVDLAKQELWSFRVGDSDLLLRLRSSWRSAFRTEPRGEGTAALPHDPGGAESVHIGFPAGHAVMLATDGIAQTMEASPDIVGSAFHQLLASPLTEFEFQRLVAFDRRGAHDDRTAVAIWNTGSSQ